MYFFFFFFFFSSRRRHTRSLCDWSSDVCSSDLEAGSRGAGMAQDAHERRAEHDEQDTACDLPGDEGAAQARAGGRRSHAVLERRGGIRLRSSRRSEERRVGKEGRSRWTRQTEKK